MPNASNTDGVRDALGGDDDHRTSRAVHRRTGARGARAARRPCSRRPPRSGGSGSSASSWNGVPCTVAGTGYTGEDGRRDRRAGRAARRLWDALVAAGRHARRARRPRHAAPRGRAAAARPRARPGHHARCKPGSAGSSRWDKPSFRGRDAARDERAEGSPVACFGHRHRRPPAGTRGVCGLRSTARTSARSRAATSRRCSATGSRSPSCLLTTAQGQRVVVDVRGKELPGHVVSTPFVGRLISAGSTGLAAALWRPTSRAFLAADRFAAGFFAGDFFAVLLAADVFAGASWRRRGGWACRRHRPRGSAVSPRAHARRRPRRRRRRPARGRRAGEPEAAEQPAGRLGELGERPEPLRHVGHHVGELAELRRQLVEARACSDVSASRVERRRGGDRGSADRPASSRRRALTVRVTWGIAALIGSSTSPSSTLIRSAVSLRFSIVRLKFSTPRRNSSTPCGTGRTSGSCRRAARRRCSSCPRTGRNDRHRSSRQPTRPQLGDERMLRIRGSRSSRPRSGAVA